MVTRRKFQRHNFDNPSRKQRILTAPQLYSWGETTSLLSLSFSPNGPVEPKAPLSHIDPTVPKGLVVEFILEEFGR